MHAGDKRGVDQGFAAGVCALLLVGEDVGFRGEGGVGFGALGGSGTVAGPFAGFGAFVGGFGAVVEAELAVREEVLVRLRLRRRDRERRVPYPLQLSQRKGRRSS